MDPVLIDLGFERGAPPMPPGDRTRRWRRWVPALRGRSLVAAAAAVVLLVPILVSVAASGARRPILRTVFTVVHDETASWTVDGDTLYLIARHDGPRLHAFRMVDGAQRWSVRLATPISETADFVGLQPAGSLVLVQMFDEAGPEWTEAHDAATGEARWAYPGSIFLAAPDGPLMAARTLGPPCEQPCERPPGPQEIAVIDAATGRPLWTIEVDVPWSGFTVVSDPASGRPYRHAALRADRLEVRDLVTGELLLARPIPVVGPEVSRNVWPAGDVLVVTTSDSGTATAYDAVTLADRWTVEDFGVDGGVWPCGAARLCRQLPVGFSVHDAGTARPLWTIDGEHPYGQLGEQYFIAGQKDRRTSWLLDAQTGTRLLRLDEWQPTSPVRTPFGYLMTRHHEATQRIWLGLLRPDRAEVAPLGQLPGEWQGCSTGEKPPPASAQTVDLVCYSPRGELTVWRLRPPRLE